MALLEFVGSQAGGRGVRVMAGLAFIATGIALGGGRLALAVVGRMPLVAGVFDVFILGPLFRLPFVGQHFREATVRR